MEANVIPSLSWKTGIIKGRSGLLSFVSFDYNFFKMARADIPPGISFIFSRLPLVLVSIGGTYAALILARQHFALEYPLWVDIIAAFILQPIILFVRGGLSTLAKRRKAVSMGAVMPPQVSENSFQVTKTIVSSFQDGYIGSTFPTYQHVLALLTTAPSLGDCFSEWSKQHGDAYQISAFGRKHVSAFFVGVHFCSCRVSAFSRSSQPNLNISRSVNLVDSAHKSY
jgi:hypothetical protein